MGLDSISKFYEMTLEFLKSKMKMEDGCRGRAP